MTKLVFEGKSMLDIQRLLRGQSLRLVRTFYKMRRSVDERDGRWHQTEIVICFVVPNAD